VDYIRYHEVEQLYKLYPTIKAILESLHIDLNMMQEQQNIDDDIYAECMGKHEEGSTIPPVGKVSDITGNIAIRHRLVSKLSAKEVKRDILELSAIIEKISVGINSLSKLQYLILEQYYWELKTWKQVSESLKEHNYYRNKDQCMMERQRGIKKIRDIAKIPIEKYAWVTELVKGNGGGD
jgi:hypothetical protein